MTIPSLFILGCWAVYVVIWTGLAGWSKPSIRKGSFWQWLIRPGIVVMAVALQSSGLRHSLGGFPPSMAVAILGDVLCAAGIALAIWARLTLGRNWGMPMSHKEGAELITRGPYTLIRHPIYSGVLLALFGTALVGGVAWLLFFVLIGAFFIHSARQEEQRMVMQFPEAYGDYKARTKMLVPWIF
jgi:protein-S-isoprenylcysteine O-methyltransferase Ste14